MERVSVWNAVHLNRGVPAGQEGGRGAEMQVCPAVCQSLQRLAGLEAGQVLPQVHVGIVVHHQRRHRAHMADLMRGAIQVKVTLFQNLWQHGCLHESAET